MTHISKPNRRPIPGLAELVNGGSCRWTGKVRWLDERTATRARDAMAARDPDPERSASLEAFRHDRCGDWHVGHRRVPRGTE